MQAFDTLKVSQDLETVFPPNQAKMLSKVLFEFTTGDLATGHDIDRLEQRLEVEVTRLDAKVETQGASIRSEIKEAKLDLIKWIVGALILNFVGSAGLMITLIHNVKP